MTPCDAIHRRIILAAAILVGAAIGASVAAAQCIRPNDCLPPPGGCVYVGPNTVCFPGSPVCIRDLELQDPTACTSASAGTFDSFFDITYRIQRSTDGGSTFTPVSGVTSGGMHFMTTSPPYPQVIETELLSLDLTGGSPFMIRESPSRPSVGQTAITPDAGGYRIDSFFDVFTELSVDGGQTWLPSDSSLHTQLGGSPTAALPSSWGSVKALYR